MAHFSLYIFALLLFYTYRYYQEDILFWIVILTISLGIVWFELLPKIQILKNDMIFLRYIGIIFSYIGVLLGIIYVLLYPSSIIFVFLILSFGYNLYLHKKYVNYISFGISVFLGFFLLYYSIISYQLLYFDTFPFFALSLFFSFMLIFLTYILSKITIVDIYILHIYSYIINASSVLIFFLFNDFEVLHIGVLLLLESIYFFLSYNKLNKGSKSPYLIK